MASYTEILPDGSRRVVKYNPNHDGPVSEYLCLQRKIARLKRKRDKAFGATHHPLDRVIHDLHRKSASVRNLTASRLPTAATTPKQPTQPPQIALASAPSEG